MRDRAVVAANGENKPSALAQLVFCTKVPNARWLKTWLLAEVAEPWHDSNRLGVFCVQLRASAAEEVWAKVKRIAH